MGTIRCLAARGRDNDLFHPGKRNALEHFHDPDSTGLSPDTAVDKDHTAVDPGYPQPLL